jgi:uncharacterized membrane protein YfcA
MPARLIGCGLAAYLLTGAFTSAQVSMDLQLSSFGLLSLLVARLTWSRRLRFIPLRLLVFPAIAFVVYLFHHDTQASGLLSSDLRTGLLVVLLIMMLLAIQFAQKEIFQTTPTDILVIALVGGVSVLYEHGVVDNELAPMVVELVLLFYAAELSMRQMQRTWNCFSIGVLAALAFLAARLVV